MLRNNPFTYIRKLNRPVFTTREIAEISGKSLSSISQSLSNLEKHGLISKIYHGIWADSNRKDLSPYSIIPALFPKQRAYISFVSALNLYGIVEQIPQVITVASTSHTRVFRTKMGVVHAHRIEPSFFQGFDWYGKTGDFLIAEPEKAFIDCLYVSVFKNKQFGQFPELDFKNGFSMKKAVLWIKEIKNKRIRNMVEQKFNKIIHPPKR